MRALVIESTNGVGDSLTVSAPVDGTCEIEINNPWAGDTVTGIGRYCCWDLNLEQAKLVRDHLDKFLNSVEEG